MAEERKKYDKEFKAHSCWMKPIKGQGKRSSRGVWDRPANALIMAISIQEPQRDCILWEG